MHYLAKYFMGTILRGDEIGHVSVNTALIDIHVTEGALMIKSMLLFDREVRKMLHLA
jgi:hypothetical protein